MLTSEIKNMSDTERERKKEHVKNHHYKRTKS